MKRNISKMWRSALALLMVLCMSVGLFPAAAFAAEETLSYVSLGDGMTSGEGLDAVENTYPGILAQVLEMELSQQAAAGTSMLDLKNALAADSEAAALRDAVAGADLITFGMGHTDFTDAYVNMIVEAGKGNAFAFDLEAAIAAYPAELQTLLTALRDQLTSVVKEYVSDATVRTSIVNYTMNYMVNYVGAMDGIMALNPEAVVILLGVLNYYEGRELPEAAQSVGFNLYEMFAEVQPYMNAYMAGIPAVLQLMGQDTYELAVFYYAEEPVVELQPAGCPTSDGHDALANAIITTLENAYTANDKLMDSKEEILHGLVESESNEGTHGTITVGDDTHYVAIGDGPAVSESYADLLAADLGVTFTNLAESGMFVQDAAAVITANQAEIEKADLVTVGFSNVPFLTQAMNKFLNADAAKPDWSTILNEDEQTAIQSYLAALEANLGGFDPAMKEKTMYAVESYMFNCVAYAVKMPELIDQIHEINPDALVAIIGMYNPLDGIALNMGEGMTFSMGELFDEMVDVMALYDIMYTMGHENTFYVYAPDVAIKWTKAEMTSIDMYRVFLVGKGKELNPSEEGQAYILGQINNALTVKEPTLLGDVDHSGAVDFFDAMLALQYYAGLAEETALDVSVADVDASGSVDFFDGMYMLQYYAGVIEKLPAEG